MTVAALQGINPCEKFFVNKLVSLVYTVNIFDSEIDLYKYSNNSSMSFHLSLLSFLPPILLLSESITYRLLFVYLDQAAQYQF
jgi:hypothetical protein